MKGRAGSSFFTYQGGEQTGPRRSGRMLVISESKRAGDQSTRVRMVDDLYFALREGKKKASSKGGKGSPLRQLENGSSRREGKEAWEKTARFDRAQLKSRNDVLTLTGGYPQGKGQRLHRSDKGRKIPRGKMLDVSGERSFQAGGRWSEEGLS